jgi:ferredoxin
MSLEDEKEMPIVHSLYRESGRAEVNVETCTRCGKCVQICAGEALEMTRGQVRARNSALGCIACGHCMMACPTGSIKVTGRGISPDDLLPLPPQTERATAGAWSALMRGRRSVRFFTDEAVSDQDVTFIADMAASAPMGVPPWDIGCVTIQGREKIREIAGEIIQGYEQFLKIFRPWVLSMMRPIMKKQTREQFRDFILPLARTYVKHWRAGRDVLFYDAPALLIFHHSPYADHVDTTIACTYAMLAAESLRLGSTIIGGAPPILQRNKALSASLGIPEQNKAASAIIIGHPAVSFERGIRRQFTSVRNIR